MKLKKILSIILALTMLISVFPMHVFTAETEEITFTALDGTQNNGENQSYAKLLDGATNTKWCDKIGTEDDNTYIPYIIFKASRKVIINDYTFVTGNDNNKWTGRNPKDWTLYGCNDYDETNKTGGTWAEIHSVTDDTVMRDVNYRAYTFTLTDNTDAYQYYKLVITANHGSQFNLMQLTMMRISCTPVCFVTFDKNGGDTYEGSAAIQAGKGLPTVNPIREAHRFLGWYTQDGMDDNYGIEFTREMCDEAMEDVVVFAKWEPAKITLDKNGGDTDANPTQLLYLEEPFELPTRAGFVFDGWYTKNGTGGDWGDKYPQNVKIYGDTTVYAKWKAYGADCLSDVAFRALSGTGGFTGEDYGNLVDGRKIAGDSTKWCVSGFSNGTGNVNVILEASAYTIVTKYTFVTANDTKQYPKRNPKSWTLYGSNDYDDKEKSGTWSVIDSVTDNATLGAANYTAYDFSVDNTKAYKYYKLEITANYGDSAVQLGELEFTSKGCEHMFGDTVTVTPSCTVTGKTVYTCTECGIVHNVITKAAEGHIPGENERCSVCGELYGALNGDEVYTDLQTAIDSAADGDIIKLNQNFDISSSLEISKKLTLDLNDHTIRMTGVGSVIRISQTGDLTLEDMGENKSGTLADGNNLGSYGSGGINSEGKLTMNGGTITNCKPGGVRVGEEAVFTMNGGTIKNCTASNAGGVYVYYGKFIMNDGLITECTQTNEGAVLINYGNFEMNGGEISKNTVSNGPGGGVQMYNATMTMNGGTIKDNSVNSFSHCGGGINVWKNSSLTLSGTAVIENNYSGMHGGGVAIDDNSSLTMTGGEIKNNGTPSNGGGIYVTEGSISISGGTITDNTAFGGGGISLNNASTAVISSGVISGNKSINSQSGGGVRVENSSTLDLTGGEIKNNITYGTGGGISGHSASNVNISGTALVSGNEATSRGGGIWVGGNVKLTMTGGTVENNKANGSSGGGIEFDEAIGTVSDVLIKGNSVMGFGGGVNVQNSTVTFGNTQIIENKANSGGGLAVKESANVTVNGGKIFDNKSTLGCGVYINDAAVTLQKGAEISGNGSAAGRYNSNDIYGAGVWISNGTLNVYGADIVNNNAYNGGGIYTYDELAVLNLADGHIMGNKAVFEGGGISSRTNDIIIKGGIQITDNKLVSETTLTDSNVRLKNGATIQVETPATMTDDRIIDARIGVNVEDENGNITAAHDNDYSRCFISDLPGGRIIYDSNDKIVKLIPTYKVTFDCGGDSVLTETVDKNTPVSEPEPPTREGYYFGGWYAGDTPYDFADSVSADTMLTAKWLEAGKFGISITPSKIYVVSNKARVFGASYSGDVLIDNKVRNVEGYDVIYLKEISLDIANADKISLFAWDKNLTPLCRVVNYDLK